MQKKDTDKQEPKNTGSLKDKMHKHISDKNDVISEDDLKSMQVGEESFENKTNGKESSRADEDDESSEEMTDALSKKEITTPWDILDEED